MLKVTVLTPAENADRVLELLEETDGVIAEIADGTAPEPGKTGQRRDSLTGHSGQARTQRIVSRSRSPPTLPSPDFLFP